MDNTRNIRRIRANYCIMIIVVIIIMMPIIYMHHQITTGVNVNTANIPSYTGITFPSDSRFIGARYMGGWQDSILFARIEIENNEIERFIQTLSKSMTIKRFEMPISRTLGPEEQYPYEYERSNAIRSMKTGREPEWWNPESASSFIYASKLAESDLHPMTRINIIITKNEDSFSTVYILKIN